MQNSTEYAQHIRTVLSHDSVIPMLGIHSFIPFKNVCVLSLLYTSQHCLHQTRKKSQDQWHI